MGSALGFLPSTRLSLPLGCAVLLTGAALVLCQCDLLVNLDVEEVEAGPPDGCAICTELEDAGEDDAAPEAASTDGGVDASPGGDASDGAAAADTGTGG